MTSIQIKIKKVSVLFRWLFTIFLIALPLVHIIAWLHAPRPVDISGIFGFIVSVVPKGVTVLHSLSPATKLLGFLVSAIPVIALEFMLYFLVQLFKLYEKLEIFSIRNVQYIKGIGVALLISQITTILCNGFLSVILTWNNPHGFRSATLTVCSNHLGMILTAFIIILISWIMAESSRLREEQQLTI